MTLTPTEAGPALRRTMLQGYLPHKKTPPPGGRQGALGIVLLWKPTEAMFLMSEVQDRMVARSMKGSDQDTHVLREGQAQPTVAVGGISTADRDCLAAASDRSVSC